MHRRATLEGVALDDMVCDCATVVDSNIPMLNSERLATLLRIRERRNIT